jgi:hypothetical protein
LVAMVVVVRILVMILLVVVGGTLNRCYVCRKLKLSLLLFVAGEEQQWVHGVAAVEAAVASP